MSSLWYVTSSSQTLTPANGIILGCTALPFSLWSLLVTTWSSWSPTLGSIISWGLCEVTHPFANTGIRNMAPYLTYFLLYCGFLLTPKEISTSTPCVSSTGRSVLVSTLNCFLVPSWKSLRSRTINTQKVHHTQALSWLLYLSNPSMLLGDRWV